MSGFKLIQDRSVVLCLYRKKVRACEPRSGLFEKKELGAACRGVKQCFGVDR